MYGGGGGDGSEVRGVGVDQLTDVFQVFIGNLNLLW